MGVPSVQQSLRQPTGNTYAPVVIDKTFDEILAGDSQQKPQVMQQMRQLLETRYDLSNKPSQTMMSAGRKAVQSGVRVKLHGGTTWNAAGRTWPQRTSRSKNLFPMGFRPLPHVKHAPAAWCFPKEQIKAIQAAEKPRLAAIRRRLRSAGSSDAGISAADVPDHATRPGRRVAGASADDQKLLSAAARHRHAGADGRDAAAADAVPAAAVQPDRRSQGRRKRNWA